MGKQEKKVSKKRQHLREFRRQEDGSYAYEGKEYLCNLTGAQYRQRLIRMLLPAVGMLGMTIAAGCFRDTGMDGHFYLVLPYAGTLIIQLRLIWNLAQLLWIGPKLREYVYKRTAERLPPQLLFGMLLPMMVLLGILYGLLQKNYAGSGAGMWIFVLSQAASMAGCLWIYFQKKKISWKAAFDAPSFQKRN